MQPIEELIPILEQAKLSSFSGFTFRVIADRWRASPLSAIGALHRGGRYNPPGEFSVLYTADSQLTALREVEALFLDAGGEFHGVPRNPDLILTLECSLHSVLDLTEPALLKELGTSYEELVAESPSRFIENARGRSTPTQSLGVACFRSGHISAIKVPSAANPSGLCIDIFPECMFEGEFVAVRDDSATLRAELVGQIPHAQTSSLPFPCLPHHIQRFPKMPESFRDSKSETCKLLESGGTDGSFQRPEERLGTLKCTLIAPTTSAL